MTASLGKENVMRTIVVGVDGSEGAAAALRFALEEARVRGCALKVVSAWHVPAGAYESGYVTVPIDRASFEGFGRSALDKSLADAGSRDAGVESSTVLREGHAADVLVEESRDAELLVVGSRGLGGFRGLLLGSVGLQSAHYASCPVVIVPNAHGA
jgi:nucleotide-binding universal stress UspA family protein